MRVLNAYAKFLDVLTKILRVILIVLLAAMVVIMIYQVVMRYIFSHALPWAEELTLYLCVASVFLALGIATRQESHLQVDFLLSLYGPRMKCLMTALCTIVGVIVMLIFTGYSFSLMQHAIIKSITMPITMKEVYAVFPIGAILVCLYSVEIVAKNMIGFFHNGELPQLKGGKNA